MKLKFISAIAFCAMAIISCDEDTATLGNSLTSENNKLVVSTRSFDITTRSVSVDSVFSRERNCYFGMVRDPETNTYVKSEFTTQFNMMEDIAGDLPSRENFLSLDSQGKITADSCVIYVQFDLSETYGDTLTAMKMKVSELSKPISDARMHYSNYDPKAAGLIRQGGIQKQLMFSVSDLSVSTASTQYRWARVNLNDPYTDKNGTTYENYGAYILRNYYDHPEYYKNSYAFVNNICPGFFFELADGIGVMAKILQIDMYTYYHFQKDGEVLYTYLRTTSTEEVVQTTKVTNDKAAISLLAEDNSCTYMKTPAGLFTEVTLPVDEICTSHPTDSLLSAQVVFHRINNLAVGEAAYSLPVPSKVLLIEKDSLNSFFESNNLSNNRYAFETTLSNNAYTFGGSSAQPSISNLITRMYEAKVKGLAYDPNWVANHPNWNKALLVPIDETTVTTTQTSYYYSTSTTETAVALKNQMGLTSTRLVKGTAQNPIKMDVIYAKFKN